MIRKRSLVLIFSSEDRYVRSGVLVLARLLVLATWHIRSTNRQFWSPFFRFWDDFSLTDMPSSQYKMGEGASRSTRMPPHSGKRRPVRTAKSQPTGPKGVCRGASDLSPMSYGSTARWQAHRIGEP